MTSFQNKLPFLDSFSYTATTKIKKRKRIWKAYFGFPYYKMK